jgi:hypothetical protein
MVVGDAAQCTEAELLPVVRRDVPIADGYVIGRVEVTHCRNGYARVVMIPTPDDIDRDQAFLAKNGNQWSVVAFGSGIECSYPQGLPEEMVPVCRGLGPG